MYISSILKSTILPVFALLVLCQCNNQPDKPDPEKKQEKEACCSAKSSTAESETSEITCPKCGFKKVETLPTKVCMIKYKCENCGAELTPKEGDCCVFCTYGTHKCPSMQDE